ncbi:hypothetical protein KCMC57_up16100 [Kitasatospora sp. CMC57]|uniref:Lipoprotein n=1 Tax=Kitasatospora sp. CMC57 TaxID=3231513 RepID=A0AB33JQK0_9ACTN
MRRRAPLLVALALLVGTAGCAGSSRTDEDFRHKASQTLESAVSASRTITTGVDAAAAGRLTAAYTSVLVREADRDLSAVAEGFLSRQPPSAESDQLRDRVSELLRRAEQEADPLRIAVERGQTAPTAPLAAVADLMEQEQEAMK